MCVSNEAPPVPVDTRDGLGNKGLCRFNRPAVAEKSHEAEAGFELHRKTADAETTRDADDPHGTPPAPRSVSSPDSS